MANDRHPPLPSELYRAADVQAMDRYAIDTLGIPGIELMRRAGAAAFGALRTRWPGARTLSVVAGAGNNGGDGYVIARLAQESGWDVRVYPVVPPAVLKAEALAAYQEYRAAGGAILDFVPEDFEGAEVLVDALLGTGLDRPLEGVFLAVVRAINRYRERGLDRGQRGVLAVDIPSGLHADTGIALGAAVRADLTISFIGLKRGLFTGEGLEHAGEVHFDALGTPIEVQRCVSASAHLLPPLDRGLPPRPRHAHKGWFGHVLVVGGERGFGGAARLAAEAAARVGAGLVSIAAHPTHAAQLALARPELMAHGIADGEQLQSLLQRATVVVLGPGLGQSDWSHALFAAARAAGLPMVVDADGLNLLATAPARSEHWILTPHPGEAARLLGCSTSAIQGDRYAAAAELQARYGGVIVLKGSGTLIATDSSPPSVCIAGNPGMASGGMGDVLSGVIGGLLAQQLAAREAAEWGVRLHATAADLAAADGGERGLLASDLLLPLRRLVNQ